MVAIEQRDQLVKYKYEADIKAMTVNDVTKFVKDFKNGSLKPHLKSEDIPEEQTVDGLTTIVSKTWDKIVMDPNKEVLVEYYVDWCAHCMALV